VGRKELDGKARGQPARDQLQMVGDLAIKTRRLTDGFAEEGEKEILEHGLSIMVFAD
jgi:hypothetical protein